MPRRSKRHQSPITSQTGESLSHYNNADTAHTLPMTQDVLSLKNISSIMPPFVAPARIWCEKIKLIWPNPATAPQDLMTSIRVKLPPHLYDALGDSHYDSHLPLLNKIAALDGPTELEAVQEVLGTNARLRADQTPRAFFREMKRVANIAFPESDPQQIDQIAWKKLHAALPASLQQTLALLPVSVANEDQLDALEKAWKLHSTLSTTSAAVHTQSGTDTEGLTKALNALTARLSVLERSMENVSFTNAVYKRPFHPSPSSTPKFRGQVTTGDLCWYHQKFGARAYRCEPPCRFASNGSGAPSPQ
jgi:hypothetical protein